MLEKRSHRVVVTVDEWKKCCVYVHLAVEKGNKFLYILLLRVFLLIIITNISSFVSAKQYVCVLSDSQCSALFIQRR